MIHQYKLNGYNIVVDVNSGSVHCVDDVAYDIIQLFCSEKKDKILELILKKYKDDNKVNKDEILAVFDDIEDLKKEKKLFSEDIFEDKAAFLKHEHTEIKALCLHVAHTCNLNCEYCFASQGRFKGERALMSLETGKASIDFLIANSGKRKNLEVDFFGGEPLMNWEVVKGIATYGRSIQKTFNKNFRFTLTTNGIGINQDVIDFSNKEMDNVVLSLDGRKETHDNLRKNINGEGSYDIIVPKFQKFVEERGNKSYYIRGTFTHNNLDFTNDIFHMSDLGFKELSMEPVVCSPEDSYALKEEDLPKLFEQYEILAKEMLKRENTNKSFTFYHYMLDLEGGPCIYKRISGCGSGTEYFAVTPWGDLYPCHQFVGDEKYKMGSIYTGIDNQGIQEKFRNCNMYAREDCKNCWAKLYCSGGCTANAYHATGDINGIYEYGCKLFKKRIECAIMIKVAEA